ncbi:MAG TPA: thiamine phosphate synthase [Kofleriaceae bacterium]|nr:thiamine phosphate synthase [Kofleriaceae bacterium]
MQLADAIRGFYAVLDRDDPQLARALLTAGARVLQLRIKGDQRIGGGELARIGRWARTMCDEVGAALVINDRLDVALTVGADGVHLGQTDMPLASAREVAGDRLWIGISTHDVDQVRAAVAGGADYLGFGPVFATRTKKNPDPVQGLAGLRAAVIAAGTVPVVAIGGIPVDQASAIYATGAAAICAISAVNDAPDVGLAARAFAKDSKL